MSIKSKLAILKNKTLRIFLLWFLFWYYFVLWLLMSLFEEIKGDDENGNSNK